VYSSVKDQDIIVGIVICFRLDILRNKFQCGWHFPHPSRPALELTQPPAQYIPHLSQG